MVTPADTWSSESDRSTVIGMAGKPRSAFGLQTTAARRDARGEVAAPETVKSADREKVRAAVRKIRHRDAELLKRLAR